MKMILAYVPPHRLDRVTRALEHLDDLPGMTVTKGQGFGREKLEVEAKDRRAELVDYTDVVRIEVCVPDGQVGSVMDAITGAARTGQRGDGKIFVLPVERGRRIRTGEEGEAVVG